MPLSDWGVADSLRNPVFDLFLLGVGQACDEIGANLVIVPARIGNSGIPQFRFGPRSPPGQRHTPQAVGTPTDQEKFHGYADALCDAGLDIHDVPMVQADPWDRDAARMMLDAAPDATAILSMSVMQAIAVINEARRRGLSVPRDLSVVGYNDIPDAERSDPPLTTVDGLGIQKWRTAARIVFEGGPPRHEILKPRLIMRASTGPAPVR